MLTVWFVSSCCLALWPSSRILASERVTCKSWSGTGEMNKVCSDIKRRVHSHRTSWPVEPKFLWCKLHSKNSSRSHSWLQTHPRRKNVIDTMLFKCKQRRQAAFSHHTPHFLRIDFVRWNYALITILPRALGTEGFVSAVGRDLTIGASRWLWSDRPLAVSSVKTSHLPNARRGHSIRLGRRRGTYFLSFFFFSFFFFFFFSFFFFFFFFFSFFFFFFQFFFFFFFFFSIFFF